MKVDADLEARHAGTVFAGVPGPVAGNAAFNAHGAQLPVAA
jgi:hypothetical protein